MLTRRGVRVIALRDAKGPLAWLGSWALWRR